MMGYREKVITRHNASERRQLQKFIDAQKKKGKDVYILRFNRGKVFRKVTSAKNVLNFGGDMAVAVKKKKQLNKVGIAVRKYRKSPFSKSYSRLVAAEILANKHPAISLAWI